MAYNIEFAKVKADHLQKMEEMKTKGGMELAEKYLKKVSGEEGLDSVLARRAEA